MSFKAMAWVAKQKVGNSTRKFILMMLADKANDSGLCWPSHKTIMDDCEIGSKTTLIKHLQALEEAGVVQIIRRSKEGVSLPNHYKLKTEGVVQEMNGGSTNNELRGSTNNEHKPTTIEPINEPIKKVNQKRFTPPTIEEVQEYCKSRNNRVNQLKWYDHYVSNGWMVGKNKMKDWRAAVRTWENNAYGNQQQKSTKVEAEQGKYGW